MVRAAPGRAGAHDVFPPRGRADNDRENGAGLCAYSPCHIYVASPYRRNTAPASPIACSTLEPGPDQLMAPPLMAQLVCGDEIRQVHIVLVQHAADETDSLGKWHGIRKRLREPTIAWKFHDAILRELVRAVMGLVIIEPGATGGQHVIDIVGVRRIVIDFKIHGAVRAVVNLFSSGIAS